MPVIDAIDGGILPLLSPWVKLGNVQTVPTTEITRKGSPPGY